ncbi:uncharacterized protein LOC144546091 [Carex rostrata]
MAENMSVSNPLIPLFKGDNYEFWSIKIRTLLKSQGLWELVETGAPTADPTPTETAKRDAKALFFIQQAVHDTIFSKIAAATNAKEAWTTLKTAFQGSTRVMAIKLQGLRRDFETLQMNKEESVQIFLSRVQGVVNQIRAFGDTMEEKTVVAKVLRSLTPKFDHVVAAIEESKDLATYTFDELMGSLQTHEARMSKAEDKGDDKAFYTKGESSRGRSNGYPRSRGSHNPSRGQANSGRGGRGRGRSNTAENSQSYDESKKDIQCYYCNKFGHYQSECYEAKKNIQCYYCNKFGHYQSECYKKQREENQASYVVKENDQPALFMAYTKSKIDASNNGTVAVHTRDNGGSSPESSKIMVSRNILFDEKALKVENVGLIRQRPLKLVYNHDIRLAQISEKCSFKVLRDIVTKMFPSLKSVLIKYKDSDGDLVTITDTQVLRMAESCFDQPIQMEAEKEEKRLSLMRLHIVEVNPEQEPTITEEEDHVVEEKEEFAKGRNIDKKREVRIPAPDGSGLTPDLLTQAEVIMERGDDMPSQVSGSFGNGRGFLEMKSITGEILKKVITEDTVIKQEKVTVEVGERNQEQVVIDKSEGCHPSQQEKVTILPVSTVTYVGPKMMPSSSDSNMQTNKDANIKTAEEEDDVEAWSKPILNQGGVLKVDPKLAFHI